MVGSPSALPGSRSPRASATAPNRALIAGILAWVTVMVVFWPSGLSFQDDVGYVGEARLVLAGHARPQPDDVGVWVPSVHGTLPKFPLFPSLLLVPLVAASPKLVFLLGIGAAIALCWTAGQALKAWGTNPTWALLFLAHPTIVILSRTVTADLPLSAFALGAWWATRRRHRLATVALFGVLLPTKATGPVLGLALAGGELLRMLPALRRREREAWRDAATIAVGLALGASLLVGANEISAGGPGFAYDLRFLGTPPFWFTYFPKSAPAHLRTYLLLPPLLILGVLPFWRRREWGPLCLIGGLGVMMCFYFFVDFGTSRLESLVLAPRLVLPVVTFLLLGYANLLGAAANRLQFGEQTTSAFLVLGTVAVALAVSVRHHRWQIPMREALAAATRAAGEVGKNELGVSQEALKVGVLFPGAIRFVGQNEADTPVVLCSTRSASYRQPLDGPYSCTYPGYRLYFSGGDFRVLVRASAPSALRGTNDLPR